jgi:hypothetical protein
MEVLLRCVEQTPTADKTLSVEVKPLVAVNNLHVSKCYVAPAVWMQTGNGRETSDLLWIFFSATCVKRFEITT